MNLVPPKDSPDKSDLKPSFRKPSNDSVNRKYRHHSPADGSDSSSSGGIPKREHHNSSGNSMANRHKISDDRDRKYHGKEPERDPGLSHSTRGSDSYRYSDNKSRRSSSNYQHSDDGGYHRLANDEDRDSIWYSKDGRELRSGRADYAKHNDSSERPKEINRNSDRNVERYDSREKYENSGHRSRGNEREVNAPDHRYNEIESSRAAIGSRQMTSRRDNKRGDHDKYRKEKSDSYLDKNSKATEEQNSSSKKLKSGESDKFPRSMAEGKSSTSSNQVDDANEKFTFGQTSSANIHVEPAQDFNAAKVAAMKAAELADSPEFRSQELPEIQFINRSKRLRVKGKKKGGTTSIRNQISYMMDSSNDALHKVQKTSINEVVQILEEDEEISKDFDLYFFAVEFLQNSVHRDFFTAIAKDRRVAYLRYFYARRDK